MKKMYYKIKLKELVNFIFVMFGANTNNYILVIEDEDERAEISCDIFLGSLPVLLGGLADRYVYNFTVDCAEYKLHVLLFPEVNE